ncbi:MAG: hypothetical protein MUF71_07735 [Candidatus Kapabacteria bacterium]|jgi:hypothetical protein|nr:hypothetical protein [Candidatus Kapabacteria bacterium]
MNTTHVKHRIGSAVVMLFLLLICAATMLSAQEKKESDSTKSEGAKNVELRYYVNYGYRGQNAGAINLELSKVGMPDMPSGMFDVSFGTKRFFESNWMVGFDFGVTLGGTRNTQFSNSTIGIYEKIWGGYRFVNSESVKMYGAIGIEPYLGLSTISRNQTTSFANYLANPTESAPPVRFTTLGFNLPIMLNAEIKLPRLFNEKTDTWLGIYAGYIHNLTGNMPLSSGNGVRFTDAPRQPEGGFIAGISLSFDWVQAWRESMSSLLGEKK